MTHRHPRRRHYPNCWDVVGGHIEPGETPADAIRRECSEELGIDVDDPQPMPMTVSDPLIEMHGFVVTRWRGDPTSRRRPNMTTCAGTSRPTWPILPSHTLPACPTSLPPRPGLNSRPTAFVGGQAKLSAWRGAAGMFPDPLLLPGRLGPTSAGRGGGCGKKATLCHMTTIASRDLRNHTAAVLKQVADGAEIIVTVHGEPAALITRPRHRRRAGLPKAELFAFLDRQEPDSRLSEDIAWISEGSTDELGSVR